MARAVNVFSSGWQALGTTASCPRYSMSLRFEWIDDDGVPRVTADTTVTFPNVLGQLTPTELSWFGEELQELIIRIGRRRAGVDA